MCKVVLQIRFREGGCFCSDFDWTVAGECYFGRREILFGECVGATEQILGAGARVACLDRILGMNYSFFLSLLFSPGSGFRGSPRMSLHVDDAAFALAPLAVERLVGEGEGEGEVEGEGEGEDEGEG